VRPIAIFVTAALARLIWLWHVYGARPYNKLQEALIDFGETSDAGEYVMLARNISSGIFSLDGVTPTHFRGPGYPVFIASLWWGSHPVLLLLIAQCLIGAGTAVLVYLITREIDQRLALIAGLCMALAPFSVVSTSEVLTETLYTLIVTFGIYLWIKNKCLLAGFVFGLSWLVRPTTMAFILFVLAASVVIPKLKQYRREVLVISLAALVTVSPWIIRNAIAFKKFIPVATAGGKTNLLSGTFDINYNKDVWSQWRNEPALRSPYSWHDPRTEDLHFQRALERIKADPIAWIANRVKQYPRLLLDTGSYLYPSPAIEWIFVFASILFLILASVGAYNLGWEYPQITALPMFLLLFHIPLWVELRYSLPMIPLVVILAIVGYDKIAARTRWLKVSITPISHSTS
jgi:4-amino-4-deoxy-L-arabinose transferase-like glycosyltransferase